LKIGNRKIGPGNTLIAKELGLYFYFATPYHSWERGSIVNLRGNASDTSHPTRSFTTSPPTRVLRLQVEKTASSPTLGNAYVMHPGTQLTILTE